MKNFRGVKLSRFRSIREFGQTPGEFLVFSLLPGIRRARHGWLYIVTIEGVDLRAHLFIDRRRKINAMNIAGISLHLQSVYSQYLTY